MKTSFFPLFTLLIVASMFTACSDEEENTNLPFPDVSKITLSETISTDRPQDDVSKKDVYSFMNNRLMTHTTIQEFHGQSVSRDISFSYSDHQAILTDANGNKATYTLNDKGYATQCTYKQFDQTRKYQFSYANDYLIRIDEEIDGAPFSTIELQYASGNLQSIRWNGQTFLFEVNEDINVYHLPCLLFEDMHPLSMHIDAIYARLLGKQSTHLVTRNAPEGNEKEWTTYIYNLNAENKPTQIQALTTSTGLVYDINGTSSEVTRTDSRKLSVQVE